MFNKTGDACCNLKMSTTHNFQTLSVTWSQVYMVIGDVLPNSLVSYLLSLPVFGTLCRKPTVENISCKHCFDCTVQVFLAGIVQACTHGYSMACYNIVNISAEICDVLT